MSEEHVPNVLKIWHLCKCCWHGFNEYLSDMPEEHKKPNNRKCAFVYQGNSKDKQWSDSYVFRRMTNSRYRFGKDSTISLCDEKTFLISYLLNILYYLHIIHIKVIVSNGVIHKKSDKLVYCNRYPYYWKGLTISLCDENPKYPIFLLFLWEGCLLTCLQSMKNNNLLPGVEQ